jgi:hypothetical protein
MKNKLRIMVFVKKRRRKREYISPHKSIREVMTQGLTLLHLLRYPSSVKSG